MAYDKNNAVVEIIHNEISLVDVADRLGLAQIKSGNSTKIFCPFNSHKKPSCELYDQSSATEPRHYHCYACGEHGDAIDLVKQVLSLDFKQSLDWFSREYGIKGVQKDGRGAARSKGINAKGNGFVQALALFKKSGHEKLLASWIQSRKLPEGIVAKADLAISYPGVLAKRINEESGSEARALREELEASGLIRKVTQPLSNESSEYLNFKSIYRDYFYDERIVFPIQTDTGQLVGFAGRSFGNSTNQSSPKYLYTRGLQRASTLYRSHIAFSNICSSTSESQFRDLYICEGLVDALRLESFGLNAVAVLGSHLSKGQADLISSLSEQLGSTASLRCFIFLDNDTAGLRGAAKSIVELTDRRIQTVFVCAPSARGKDPDEILSGVPFQDSQALIWEWTHPPALAVMAFQLGISPEKLIDPEVWEETSISKRLLVARRVAKNSIEEDFLFYIPQEAKSNGEKTWLTDVRSYRSVSSGESKRLSSQVYIEDATARLNHSRLLARSGAQRGEVPSDDAAWSRIDIAATAFNEALKTRFRQSIFSPLEPFDAVHVSRGFGKDEPRLKAMPCPEDLIAQQYMLNEILSERMDLRCSPNEVVFSRFIPAVRYYRALNRTITTGENIEGNEELQTLSFAYQIDMEVIEGERAATNQGMFRNFFECWSEFNLSLQKQARRMEKVYSVRLDLSRFYDNIPRSIVRDALKNPFRRAFQRIQEFENQFAELFSTKTARSDAVVDWLCDQSFGYHYYDPADGSVKAKPGSERIGIPQGPVLSAWLATVALFPLDNAMRGVLNHFNSEDEGVVRAGYARYVDDVVLIADSPKVLSVLRATAEDAVRRLQLEILQKGEKIPPLSPEKFSQLIVQGRAFVGSGPTWEPDILRVQERPDNFNLRVATTRAESLWFLSDNQLPFLDVGEARDRIYTAMEAIDLRPGDLAKIAGKLWYLVSRGMPEGRNPRLFWDRYWSEWRLITRDVSWTLSPKAQPWDDPYFYAIEGLELLIKGASHSPVEWSVEERSAWHSCIQRAITNALDAQFTAFFLDSSETEDGFGSGVKSLPRMFWQRWLTLRWKMEKIRSAGFTKNRLSSDLRLRESIVDSNLRNSLVRALIAEAETSGEKWQSNALDGRFPSHSNPLRSLLLGLHEAVALFKIQPLSQQENALAEDRDPLLVMEVQISEILDGFTEKEYVDPHDRCAHLLNFLSATPSLTTTCESDDEIKGLALAVLSSISHRKTLLKNLEKRPHLLGLDKNSYVQPSLPGINPPALICISGSEISDSPLIKIESITRIATDMGGDGIQEIPALDIWESTASSVPERAASWEMKSNGTDILDKNSIQWASKANQIHVSVPSCDVIDYHSLKFVADAFEAIAKINAKLVHLDEPEEYIPAWPFIAADSFDVLDSSKLDRSSSSLFSLISCAINPQLVGNFAFVRDGTRGLSTVQVPGRENAWLWRIGFALTDLMGLVEDLDHDRIDVNDQSNEASHAEFKPATYMLRSMLLRLRGRFANKKIEFDASSGLPVQIQRWLNLMRSYPQVENRKLEAAYVFSVEWENRAMAYRLESANTFAEKVDIADFLVRSVNAVFRNLPASWVSALPSGNAVGGNYRRTVRGWITVKARLDLLVREASSSNVVGQPLETAFSLKILLAALNLTVISTWLRALAFDLAPNIREAANSIVDASSTWEIDAPIFIKNPRESETVFLLFERAIEDKSSFSELDRITPIGWLSLVAWLSGAVSSKGEPTSAFPENLHRELKQMAKSISVNGLGQDDANSWPFECVSDESMAIIGDDFLEKSLAVLARLEASMGVTVSQVRARAWTYDRTEKTFIDGAGTEWKLRDWKIDQTYFDRRTESYLINGRYQKIWTETRNSKNELIGVSVLGERFAKFAPYSDSVFFDDSSSPEAEFVRSELIDATADENATNAPDRSATEDTPSDHLDDAESEGAKSPDSITNSERLSAEPFTDYGAASDPVISEWQDYQAATWKARKTRTSSHIRTAIFQFRVDDSYYHPLSEVGLPSALENAFDPEGKFERSQRNAAKNSQPEVDTQATSPLALAEGLKHRSGSEWKWKSPVILPSWAEHRRRRLLVEAIKACDNFGVDILVLPEYSVRPDTISWLKEYLASRQLNVSIVAGTYRIHGTSRDEEFRRRFGDIWGHIDHGKVFGSPLAMETEKSSYITLLAPFQLPRIGHTVAAFSRAKKYSSVAMGEFFRPGIERWAPLFSLSSLVDYVEHFIKDKDGGPETLSGKEMAALAEMHIPLRSTAELICSELFLPTSPANWPAIASEYVKLLQHFGYKKSVDEAYSSVREDLNELAMAMSPAGFSMDGKSHGMTSPRRSILVVPALTGRSADYWIYGQSALLSAGVTTVFCTGVGAKFSGGSCFIGRKSWEHSRDSLACHHDQITPYAGWSRGIYYNKPSDALGESEQALVIADIDPLFMNEGKPRPQVLPVPLQLVAHLPVIESFDLKHASELKKKLSSCVRGVTAGKITLPTWLSSTDEVKETVQEIIPDSVDAPEKIGPLRKFFSGYRDDDVFGKRLEHWINNGRDMPGVSPSPAVMDWLWIDLTPNSGPIADIYVPAWSHELKDKKVD